MKNFIEIGIVLGLTATMISCDSRTRVTEVRVYRAPDGVIYRRGEVYTTVYGDVYQNGVLIRRAPTVIIDEPNLPPGQMKKIYGTQSARDFAPGHNKWKGRKHKH